MLACSTSNVHSAEEAVSGNALKGCHFTLRNAMTPSRIDALLGLLFERRNSEPLSYLRVLFPPLMIRFSLVVRCVFASAKCMSSTPTACPSHLSSSSGVAIMNRPCFFTGIPSCAQCCTIETGCPRKAPTCCQPLSCCSTGPRRRFFAVFATELSSDNLLLLEVRMSMRTPLSLLLHAMTVSNGGQFHQSCRESTVRRLREPASISGCFPCKKHRVATYIAPNRLFRRLPFRLKDSSLRLYL